MRRSDSQGARLGRHWLRVGTVASVLLMGACVSGPVSQGNRLFAKGDFVGAQQAYEEVVSKGGADSELLFRLAVIYLGDQSRDMERGQALLRQLVTEDVGGPYRPAASLLLRSIRSLGELESELEVRRQEIVSLNGEVARQAARIEGLRGAGASSGVTIEQLQRAKVQLEGRLGAAQKQAAAQAEKMQALEEELRKLKAIDLGRPPGP